MAWVPTLRALRLPPKSHKRISEGRSAACPFDDSGQGRCEKKTKSISLTTLCESKATTVGSASRRAAGERGPSSTSGAARSTVSIRNGARTLAGGPQKTKSTPNAACPGCIPDAAHPQGARHRTASVPRADDAVENVPQGALVGHRGRG